MSMNFECILLNLLMINWPWK